MVTRDRLRGGLLGLSLGDALGAPHEFKYSLPVSRYTGVLQHPISYKIRFGPIEYSTIGQVTDDTTMSVALLTSIIENKGWVEDKVIDVYLKWANSRLKFLGKNTRALFKGITTIKGYRNRYQKHSSTDIQSNGSLMRAFPLFFLFLYRDPEEVFSLILKDTKLTNPSPVNLNATSVFIGLLWLIVQGVSAAEGISKLYALATEKTVKETIHQAYGDYQKGVDKGISRDVKINKGWVLHAVYLIIIAWLLADHSKSTFSQIMNWTILQGGDTDTNGAIVGAIIGFYFGEMVMVSDPVIQKNKEILLTSEPNTGPFPYDRRYHPATALDLIDTL